MKRPFLSCLAGALSLVSLGLCLGAAVLYFLGRLPEAKYKTAFLLASIAWFVLATGRRLGGTDKRASG